MKGAVFIAFNEMIESTAGIDTWEQLLQKVQPQSDGVYTSVESYPDEELFNLVQALSEISGIEVASLVEAFGRSLFKSLNDKYPQFTAQEETFFSFIKSIDGTIHKEVNKLYTNAHLPKIQCSNNNNDELLMLYNSPRKLCVLAEGLIAGAALHYKVDCTIEHQQCMHHGADECLILLRINSPQPPHGVANE
ncbi:heme NO-binding domain-containing protein [Ferrimonas lipolytica]|uniref:4-vinyl reductase 4VR domain-containing protein n=1 Tax=Ferrimonas lipolytica TaxID=2724191 RepID=A0A6H1UBZ3_9GAMM|nr:heme NO-binding domain-containing protein [Ferrimonas lipolytica]QIZ76358.1 hypothetical protein HER31_05490 [Ferrimonas lipolytica]